MNTIPILGFAAYSGTGKTTLIEQLIRRLKQEGLRIAVIKHDAHGFDIDHEGKDTWRFAEAGSDVTIISSAKKTAYIEKGEKPFREVVSMVHDVDLILVEGYKREGLSRIGICREATGKGFTDDFKNFVAIATDIKEVAADIPCFSLTDIEGIARFILENRFSFTQFIKGYGIAWPLMPLKKEECSAIVLAGGRGSRLGGVSKAELTVGGTRFMDRLAKELRGFAEYILSTNAPDMAKGTVFSPVMDDVPGLGPMGGIFAALRACRCPHVIVTACDMPCFKQSLADWLLAQYRGEDTLICRTKEGKLHPLCGIYTKNCLPVLEKSLADGHLKITRFLQEVNCRIIDIPEEFEEQFTNVNTPDDLKRVEEKLKAK